MCESPSGADSTVIVSDVETFHPAGTMKVLPSVSAHGVSPAITFSTGAGLGAGGGAWSAVGGTTGVVAGSVAGSVAGLGDDEHAATSTAQTKLRMRGP